MKETVRLRLVFIGRVLLNAFNAWGIRLAIEPGRTESEQYKDI